LKQKKTEGYILMETNKSRSRKPTLRIWADDLTKEVDNIVEKLRRERVAITEDVLFLLIFKYLKASQGTVVRSVFHNVGKEDWAYYFAPDADLLEFRPDGTVIGYELKGFQKVKDNYEPPGVYVGLDQALAYLRNPCIIDSCGSISCTRESIFDFVYLVHATTDVNRFDESMCAVIDKCTPHRIHAGRL
jgi:hypothetical protein